MMGTGEAAYRLRLAGWFWPEIEEALPPANGRRLPSYAESYARNNGLRWPVGPRGRMPLDRETPEMTLDVRPPAPQPQPEPEPEPETDPRPLGERAYHLRATTGASWTEIIDRTEARNARAEAEDYASRESLPWPVPTAAQRGTVMPTSEEGRPRGRSAYHLGRVGVPWGHVAVILCYSTSGDAIDSAKWYALKHRLRWPLHQLQQPPQRRSSRGRLAYEMRVATGKPWGKIGADLGLKAPQPCARKHALRAGLPWPPVVQADVERRVLQHEAYILRAENRLPYNKIGRRLGMTKAAAQRAVAAHAARNGVEVPPEMMKGEIYYREREAGHSWRRIADDHNIKHVQHAVQPARYWAEKTGALWPPVPGDRRKRAYIERAMTGDKWEVIAERLGYNVEYKHGYNATEAARKFAKANGLPWPVPKRWSCPENVGSAAYFYRGAGLPWRVIKRMTASPHPQQAASRFAASNGLPWPIDVEALHRN